jgi:hypothetical protein
MYKFYLAGPMSGIKSFNYPAFFQAAKELRANGYAIVCPAELDDEETVALALASEDGTVGEGSPNGETWGDFLARDVKIVGDQVDGVVLLPYWFTSRGARLETFVALSKQLPVYYYIGGGQLVLCSNEMLMEAIGRNTLDQGDTSRYEEE